MSIEPDPVALQIAWLNTVALLTEMVGSRIGSKVDAQLPAVRVTLSPAPPPGMPEVRNVVTQIDCYGRTDIEADTIARVIRNAIPSMAQAEHANARVSGAAVWVEPYEVEDADLLGVEARQMMETIFTVVGT